MGTGEKMTLDDIDHAYLSGIAQALSKRTDGVKWNDDIRRDGLRAVLETHVKPMLAEAVIAGMAHVESHLAMRERVNLYLPSEYAARIIASLTQDPARDV